MRKHIRKTLIWMAASAAVVFVSCESQEADTAMKRVSFVASYEGSDTKTVLSGGMVPLWEGSDKVALFSGPDGTKTELSVKEGGLSDGGACAVFEGLAVKDAVEYVAVYPYSEVASFNGTELVLNIPSDQRTTVGTFASGANTSVAYTDDGSLLFKNVGALIGLGLNPGDFANTSKVTIKAVKEDGSYHGLTGSLSQTVSDGVLSETCEGNVGSVTLLPVDGSSTFVKPGIHYAVVYPGTYSGFEVTFTDAAGKSVTKTVSFEDALELRRNQVYIMDRIPDPYCTLPDDFTFTLDFTGGKWPFVEPLTCTESTSARQYTYTYDYVYKYEGHDETGKLQFMIQNPARSTYSIDDTVNGLQFTVVGGRLVLPAIEGRYLRKVEIEKKLNGRLNISKGATAGGAGSFGKTSYVYEFFADKIVLSYPGTTEASSEVQTSDKKSITNTVDGEVYSIGHRDADATLKKLTLTYSTAAPGIYSVGK